MSGATPLSATNLLRGGAARIARFAHNEKVAGSNPAPVTNLRVKGNVNDDPLEMSGIDNINLPRWGVANENEMWGLTPQKGFCHYGGTRQTRQTQNLLEQSVKVRFLLVAPMPSWRN